MILTPVLYLSRDCTISLATVPLDFAVCLLFVFLFDYLVIVQCSVVTLETSGLVTRTSSILYLFVILFVLDFDLKLSYAHVVFI